MRCLGGDPVAWETIWLPRSRFERVAHTPVGDFPNLLYPWYQETFASW